MRFYSPIILSAFTLFLGSSSAIADRYLITYERTAPRAASLTSLKPSHAEVDLKLPPGTAQFASAIGSTSAFVIADLSDEELSKLVQNNERSNDKIKSIELDQKVEGFFTPNDTFFGVQWGLQRANLPTAWDQTRGADQVVAVLDTGIDLNHPDLANSIASNNQEVDGNGIDDDGDGYIDDRRGYDFVNSDGIPMDDHGHGTHVSGIIGASTDNAKGIAGITTSKILPVKVLGADGAGTTANVIRGLIYVADVKSKLGTPIVAVNMSLGFHGYSDALTDMIRYLGSLDITVVVAAGNEALNLDSVEVSPAILSRFLPNVISVGALDQNGNLANFSNYGSGTVTVAAPGVHIFSSYPPSIHPTGGSYAYLDGTSMAAPFVTGVIALMKSVNPHLHPKALKKAIEAGSSDNPALSGLIIGHHELTAPTAVSTSASAFNTYSVKGTISIQGNGVEGALVSCSGCLSGSEATNALGYFTFEVNEGSSVTVTPSQAGLKFSPASRSGVVTVDSTADFEASLSVHTISFTINDGRQLRTGYKVTLTNLDTGSRYVSKTNKKGVVSFHELPEGSYRVDIKTKEGKKIKIKNPTFAVSNAISFKVKIKR